DPFDLNDWEHYKKMTAEIGQQVHIPSYLLFYVLLVLWLYREKIFICALNLHGFVPRMDKLINEKACSALLLKANQIGSVTESIKAVRMSKHAGWGCHGPPQKW
ncbi:Enolase, C-terminal TIM barrel domain, partial [Dillenia turbinata]